MKFLAIACIWLFACVGVVYAQSKKVPDEASIQALPLGASFRLLTGLIVTKPYTNGLYSLERIGWRIVSPRPYSSSKKSLFKIESLVVDEAHILVKLADSEQAKILLELPKYYYNNGQFKVGSVGEMTSMMYPYFEVVQDDPDYDPYEGLVAEAKKDIVISKIAKALEAGDYEPALKDFEYLDKHNDDLPDSFHYYYTKALDASGRREEAHTRAKMFLIKFDKSSRYYAGIVDILAQ